jgi:uncharacterized membrane protein YfcA
MSSNDWLILSGIAVVSFVLSVLGATVGLVLGHFRLPLLVAYLGSAPAGATTNLAISGLGAAVGSFRHLREGRVSLSVLLLMGVPSAVGSILGVMLFIKVDRFWAHVVIGTVLAVTGYRMFRARAVEPQSKEKETDRPTGGELPHASRLLVEVGIGLFLGVLASVTGLMMNSLRLPMMVRVLKIDPHVAVGSNLMIGSLTAAVGAVSSLCLGGGFSLAALLLVGPPTMLGSYFGARLTGRLRKESLQRLLGATIALMGVVMFVEAFARLSRVRDLEHPPQTPAEQRLLETEHDEWPDWPDLPDWFLWFEHPEQG